MAYCRGVLLFTLLCIYDPVPAHRHSAITESCCKNVLEMPFPRKNYSRLEYYTILPSIKRCPQRLQFSTKGGISFCTSMRNGQQMKEFLDSQSKAPSETRPSKEFQIGRKETTGSREAASKGTFRPAISTPPQVSPVSSVPTAAPHPQGSSPNPSVPLSPLPTSTQGYEANPEPTSSVTALPESHGREDSPSPPPASSSGQLQAVTTGGWDKATYRADFHPWNGTGTAPLRAITTVTAPSNDHGMEETRTGEVTNRPSTTASQGRTMAEMARNRHPLVSKERNRASWEGPGGQRLHIGLMVVFVGAVVLILWMALISRACGQASTLADNFPWHHGEDRATLLRYSRHSEALCGTV